MARQAIEQATRLSATLTEDGLFHGYVLQADGTPAGQHSVQLTLLLRDTDKHREPLQAQTDATGYFRMDLDKTVPKASAAPVIPVIPGATTTTTTTPPAITSTVRVLDPAGKLVLSDPLPPTFEDGRSEFRYYTLGLDLGGKGADANGQVMRAQRQAGT